MAETKREFDIVSIGEPLLRLSPPRFTQLRSAQNLNLHVAGSQFNVAATLARLGKKSAFITKLPSNPLGYQVVDACVMYGVDVSYITMVSGGKMGVTYVEFSAAPRTPQAVYDRAGSAASTLTRDDYDWHEIAGRTRFIYSDGIFPGLGRGCFEATLDFFAAAKEEGCTTCYDLNYRTHLWTPETAREAWSQILPDVDIVVTNKTVSDAVFGYGGHDEKAMKSFAQDFGCSVVLMTSREMYKSNTGAWNSKALCDGDIVEGKRVEFDIIDRYGTGDAWFSGFLYGYCEGELHDALDFGNALCALAHTVEGDVANVSPEDVNDILRDSSHSDVKR